MQSATQLLEGIVNAPLEPGTSHITVGEGYAIHSFVPESSKHSVECRLTSLVGKIRENLVLRRAAGLLAGNGVISAYVHNPYAPGKH